jgi:thioredoxin-like negative regulator of GroEL
MENNERVSTLKQVLAENPKDAFARYGLAMEYSKAGDVETAMAEFRQLLEFNPDYTPGYFMAAQTLARAARNDEARELLKQGISCAARTGNDHAKSEMQAMLEELGNP